MDFWLHLGGLVVYSRWILSVKSVPEGFTVIASSSLRPSTCLASEGSLVT